MGCNLEYLEMECVNAAGKLVKSDSLICKRVAKDLSSKVCFMGLLIISRQECRIGIFLLVMMKNRGWVGD